MFYVDKGMVLQYYKKNNTTVTEHISHEGDMVICIESYFMREPSKIVASTIEPSVVYSIPRDAMEAIASHSFELCKLIFKFYQRSLIASRQPRNAISARCVKILKLSVVPLCTMWLLSSR